MLLLVVSCLGIVLGLLAVGFARLRVYDLLWFADFGVCCLLIVFIVFGYCLGLYGWLGVVGAAWCGLFIVVLVWLSVCWFLGFSIVGGRLLVALFVLISAFVWIPLLVACVVVNASGCGGLGFGILVIVGFLM